MAELLEARQLLALSIQTLPAEQVTLRSAVIGLEVTEVGDSLPLVILFWGDDDAGSLTGKWDHRVDFPAAEVGTHTVQLEQLDVDTPYFYRGLAINVAEGQSAWSDTATFQTLAPAPPQLEADPVAFVGGTNAQLSGRITDDGGDQPLVTVYYGTADGGEDPSSWERSLDLGPQGGEFSVWLDGLLPDTTYFAHRRAEFVGRPLDGRESFHHGADCPAEDQRVHGSQRDNHRQSHTSDARGQLSADAKGLRLDRNPKRQRGAGGRGRVSLDRRSSIAAEVEFSRGHRDSSPEPDPHLRFGRGHPRSGIGRAGMAAHELSAGTFR